MQILVFLCCSPKLHYFCKVWSCRQREKCIFTLPLKDKTVPPTLQNAFERKLLYLLRLIYLSGDLTPFLGGIFSGSRVIVRSIEGRYSIFSTKTNRVYNPLEHQLNRAELLKGSENHPHPYCPTIRSMTFQKRNLKLILPDPRDECSALTIVFNCCNRNVVAKLSELSWKFSVIIDQSAQMSG